MHPHWYKYICAVHIKRKGNDSNESCYRNLRYSFLFRNDGVSDAEDRTHSRVWQYMCTVFFSLWWLDIVSFCVSQNQLTVCFALSVCMIYFVFFVLHLALLFICFCKYLIGSLVSLRVASFCFWYAPCNVWQKHTQTYNTYEIHIHKWIHWRRWIFTCHRGNFVMVKFCLNSMCICFHSRRTFTTRVHF